MPETPDDGTMNRFSLTLGATAAVGEALEKAVHRQIESMNDLQRAVEACVAELRDKGVPPEKMLITMKSMIRHTAGSHPPPGVTASSWAADGYIDEIVSWSIKEYYRNTSSTGRVKP